MEVAMVGGRAVVSSFTTGPVLAKPVSLKRLVRQNPEGVIYNLLNRSERAARAGNQREAEALEAQAEQLFELVTA